MADHPVTGHHDVASFVAGETYAENFAKQWKAFSHTQVDSVNGTSISRDFLEELLGHPLEQLQGSTVLEIGAGSGRFTEHLVKYAERVVATDLSEAILANVALGAPNLVAFQADLFQMPVFRHRFDLVLCRGVLQHTPDPRRAMAVLYDFAAPSGRVVFDIYVKRALNRLTPRYLWRPLVQRIFTYESGSRFLERWTEPLLRLRWKLKPFLPGIAARILDYLIPLSDYRGKLPLSDLQLVEWARLDTLDVMFAHYDLPMTHEEVLRAVAGFRHVMVSSDPERNHFRTSP
jgi:ubiquinone/menaquinone biosynthesis C-methylase UbiE